jgi:hypothetical protein
MKPQSFSSHVCYIYLSHNIIYVGMDEITKLTFTLVSHTPRIFFIEMDEITKLTLHLCHTHHVYFSLKWMKSQSWRYTCVTHTTYIFHWNGWNHKVDVTLVSHTPHTFFHSNGWNLKVDSHTCALYTTFILQRDEWNLKELTSHICHTSHTNITLKWMKSQKLKPIMITAH